MNTLKAGKNINPWGNEREVDWSHKDKSKANLKTNSMSGASGQPGGPSYQAKLAGQLKKHLTRDRKSSTKSKHSAKKKAKPKEEIKPTKVFEYFGKHLSQQRRRPTEHMHLVESSGNKVCFSKEMTRVCQNTFPKEVQGKQTEFVCMSGPEAKVMERRVLAGDRCQELNNLPTEFSQTVYEPTNC